jgi:hypothetical protein
MEEIRALEGQACPACGGKAEWNPGKQALTCSYCGTEVPTKLDTESGAIKEIPLAAALREIPESERGWQAEKKSVQCQSCKAVMVFDPERVGQNCEFCGSPTLAPYEEIKSPLRPQSLLPFKVSEAEIRESIRQWYASKWFAPGKLKTRGLVDTVKGVYLPYWTFDAQADCQWRAEAGYYYYVTEQYTQNGRTQTRQARRVRWEPASGSLDHFFDDEPVPGSRGVHVGLLRQVEPFPTQELVPYDKAYLAGFVVEHYQVVLIDAYQRARDQMENQLRQMCAEQVPGDTYRDLQIQARYSGETFKHILVPVWLLTYTYGAKAFQLLANGHTGTMAGEYPKSWLKILLVVVLVIIAVTLIAMYSRS